LLLACAACGSAGTPEDQVRALVAEAESLAEARDAGELRSLVADDYADASGRDASEIRNLLHAWLVAHPSVNLLTSIDSIELEGTELARVQVTVGMLGREAKGDSDWDLAADVERLDIRLARDGGDWRVISAGRQDDR
jgi:SnoaL-like domain